MLAESRKRELAEEKLEKVSGGQPWRGRVEEFEKNDFGSGQGNSGSAEEN